VTDNLFYSTRPVRSNQKLPSTSFRRLTSLSAIFPRIFHPLHPCTDPRISTYSTSSLPCPLAPPPYPSNNIGFSPPGHSFLLRIMVSLDITQTSKALAVAGGYVCSFGLVSYLVKEKLFMCPSIPCSRPCTPLMFVFSRSPGRFTCRHHFRPDRTRLVQPDLLDRRSQLPHLPDHSRDHRYTGPIHWDCPSESLSAAGMAELGDAPWTGHALRVVRHESSYLGPRARSHLPRMPGHWRVRHSYRPGPGQLDLQR